MKLMAGECQAREDIIAVQRRQLDDLGKVQEEMVTDDKRRRYLVKCSPDVQAYVYWLCP